MDGRKRIQEIFKRTNIATTYKGIVESYDQAFHERVQFIK